MHKIQVDIIGLSAAPSVGGAYALLLRETFGPRRLAIVIGSTEAQAIASALEGIKPPRPMTHDLAKNLIKELGASVYEVFIDELSDNTYYSKLVLDVSGLTTEIDARPSDAIALAVRTQSPIYVSSLIMDQVSWVPSSDSVISKSSDKLSEEVKDIEQPSTASSEAKLALLEERLKDAINNEDYERAAKLRDEIAKITGLQN